MRYEEAIQELRELRAQAEILEAQLAVYRNAIEVATERHPQNNVVQALARISARNSELAIRPTHHNRRT